MSGVSQACLIGSHYPGIIEPDFTGRLWGLLAAFRRQSSSCWSLNRWFMNLSKGLPQRQHLSAVRMDSGLCEQGSLDCPSASAGKARWGSGVKDNPSLRDPLARLDLLPSVRQGMGDFEFPSAVQHVLNGQSLRR